MSEQAFDPIKPWFLTAEELGEYIGIRFGRLAPGKTEPEWIYLRHAEFDGIGGFAEILRKRGATLGRLPQIRHPASPSRLSVLKLLPKYLQPRHRVKWAALEQGPAFDGKPQPPTAAAWHVFDENETLRIRHVCR